jgi:hypothetical protein
MSKLATLTASEAKEMSKASNMEERRFEAATKYINANIHNSAMKGYTSLSMGYLPAYHGGIASHPFSRSEQKRIKAHYTSLGYKVKISKDQIWVSWEAVS